MAHHCMATKNIHGSFYQCTRAEYHPGTCKFLPVPPPTGPVAPSCDNCGRVGHAATNCPEKVGGTNAE